MANLKLGFYSIDSLGYFFHGDNAVEHCGAVSAFRDLFNWINTTELTVNETKTYQAESSFSDNDELPSYCYSVLRDEAGDYLLTLWNETSTVDGKFASIIGSEATGSANMRLQEVPVGGIPGYPSFFYICPNEQMIVCIKYDQTSGIKNLKKYLRGYLSRFSPWVHLEEGENPLDSNIIGYSDPGLESSPRFMHPRVNFSLKRKEGDIARLRSNRHRISKVIRKDEYDVSIRKERRLVSEFLKFIGIQSQDGSNVSPSSRFQYEVNFTPTLAGFNNIIDEWRDSNLSNFSNIGFGLTGEPGILWLRDMIISDEVEFEGLNLADGRIETLPLLQFMRSQKERLHIIFNSGT